MEVHHADEPKVWPLKNTETTNGWTRILELKWLQWVRAGNLKVSYVTSDVEEGMRHTKELVMKG